MSSGPWTEDEGARRARKSGVWVAPEGSGQSGDGRRDPTRMWGWIIGLTVWVAEIVLLGYFAFVLGAASIMMTANCMPYSTERHCTAWMALMLFGPLGAVALTALVMAVILAFKRNFITLAVAMVATVVVPIIATVAISEFVLGDMGIRF